MLVAMFFSIKWLSPFYQYTRHPFKVHLANSHHHVPHSFPGLLPSGVGIRPTSRHLDNRNPPFSNYLLPSSKWHSLTTFEAPNTVLYSSRVLHHPVHKDCAGFQLEMVALYGRCHQLLHRQHLGCHSLSWWSYLCKELCSGWCGLFWCLWNHYQRRCS